MKGEELKGRISKAQKVSSPWSGEPGTAGMQDDGRLRSGFPAVRSCISWEFFHCWYHAEHRQGRGGLSVNFLSS